MATRRNRIKGIANIPQRRKAENKVEELSNTFVKPQPKCSETPTDSNAERVDESATNEPPLEKLPSAPTLDKVHNAPEEIVKDEEVVKSFEPSAATKPSVELPRRRTFIKPVVNPKLLSQKPKAKLDTNQEVAKTETSNIIKIASECPPPSTDNSLLHLPLVKDQHEASLTPHQTHPVRHVPNLPPECVKSGSDSEYTAGPLSPTKLLNRSRIKAVPRLGQRRTSMTMHGSASESEDDGRRNYKRIRTESACSTTSLTNEPQVRNDPGSPQKSKEFSSIIQRKCKRTEQSRKMAEARRHFLHKFGNQTPDKQKLTMIDLIFYNPTTNPMCQKPKKQPVEETEDAKLESVEQLEEDKQAEAKNAESDEENAMPAPQIKIGANGEIVVDEKSLIIENAETKRGREELQKSKIVDGDFDTGYGIYKREKRSKDWSKEETLRFYKALNTLGTDFTLMVELFSGRSRRELKMKFKKEERVNRLLVDKALTQPVQFDITELRKEVEDEKKRLEVEAERKAQKVDAASKKVISYLAHAKKSALREKKQIKKEKSERKPNDIYSKLEKGIACVWESDSEEENFESSSTECVILKPTRSGRVPKPTKAFSSKELSLVRKKRPSDPSPAKTLHEDTFTDLSALQPGSIMIVSSQTPTGEPTFKVFMVTPTQNRIPITLTPDMLTNLTQTNDNANVGGVGNIPADNMNIAVVEENNMTIPAEEETEKISMQVNENHMWANEVSMEDNIVVSEEKGITLCSDGKYDFQLESESTEECILPD